MDAKDRAHYCPCGKLWPCRCPKAWKVMGFLRPPKAGDDQDVVCTLSCPKCQESVFLTIDPEQVDEAVLAAGRWVVTDAGGAPIGECCDLAFTTYPDGTIVSFRKPEDEKKV